MNNLHRIRLRRPWQVQAMAGRVRWTRRFNRPSRLGPNEQVWLVCEGFAGGRLDVVLNGRPLGTLPGDGSPGQFEITAALASRNELLLEGANQSGSQIATAKSGSGPFFGEQASPFCSTFDRKHGPDPFAPDFAVLLDQPPGEVCLEFRRLVQ